MSKECEYCSGKGFITCNMCRGEGLTVRPQPNIVGKGYVSPDRIQFTQNVFIPCPKCNGQGAIKCPKCKGKKIIKIKRK